MSSAESAAWSMSSRWPASGMMCTVAWGMRAPRIRALIGGTIANLLGTGDIWELNTLGAIVAIISAVLLIGVFLAIVALIAGSSIVLRNKLRGRYKW